MEAAPAGIRSDRHRGTSAQGASDSPSIDLPKGGGAIRGLGEKFAANSATGSCSFTIPLPTSPGRAGFGPQLALSYDAASGNGPFGFGWTLALPAITRRTDRGLPRYSDATDTFLISGAEDLVPILNAAGEIEDDRTTEPGYVIRRFRPRVEGLFARIERWTRTADADVHWRSISADNVLTVYGKNDQSRVFDPADRRRIFSWLICESRDDKGNAVLYDYKREDALGLNLAQAHEENRGAANDPARGTNRYIERIRYGNATTLLTGAPLRRPTHLDAALVDATRWMFELAFDYGNANDAQPDVIGVWTTREDPFSVYRPGFEIRTYRLCRRVLMFHRFPDLNGGARCLVRSLDLAYRTAPVSQQSSDPGYSFLSGATHWSYQQNAGQWHRRALPPVEFRYREATISDRVADVDSSEIENLPVGLGNGYRWVDLDGEGLPGVLTEQGGAWFYKPNRGESTNNGAEPSGPRFGPMRPVSPMPSMAALNEGRQQLLDVQGDGVLELVDFQQPAAGYHERDDSEGWKRFVPFASLPNVEWDDPSLRFLDLTGNGYADALITRQDAFTWYPSLAEKGFGVAERESTALDEKQGPHVVFADGEQAIYLADMSGDGLTDLVRVRNGEVCYWPNLGYGRFGKQVVMDGSPLFDHTDVFDQRRVRLADIDGSGTADLIYLGRDGVRLWFNRSGNSWSTPHDVPFPVATANVDQIQIADLAGNGTACLVWSSNLPADEARPLRYLDLMGGIKPHLLIEMRSRSGTLTQVSYAPSTRFYLRDLAAGAPWATKLPFPVHCVEKVVITDLHRKSVFATTYNYHHGYFDGVEREFRGFGRVEQVDTQAFSDVAAANQSSGFVTQDQTLYQPPVKTITWYHTGVAANRSRILGLFEKEYFPQRYSSRLTGAVFAERALSQPEIVAEGAPLDSDEWREAMRACNGRVLRQEVVELDILALHVNGQQVPVRLFSAAQQGCRIRRLQPRGPNRHAIFVVSESESLTYQYELSLAGTGRLVPDPRVSHSLNLRFDGYGRVQQSVSAVYPRAVQFSEPPGQPAPLTAEQIALVRAVQNELNVSYSETRFTDELPPAVRRENHRLPISCETRTFELTGVTPGAGTSYFTLAGLRDFRLNPVWNAAAPRVVTPLQYHERPSAAATNQPHARIVEHEITRCFADDLSGPLPVGQIGALGLAYESYTLALTSPLLDAVFTRTAVQDDFAGEAKQILNVAATRAGFYAGGYLPGTSLPGATLDATQTWWTRSGIAGFSANAASHFYLPTQQLDPFGNETTLAYDADDLFVRSSTNAVGSVSAVEAIDHRVLAPSRVKDANDNVSETAFDIRGLPVASAVLGKITAGVSETRDSVAALDFASLNPTAAAAAQFFSAVTLDEAQARRWLGRASARVVYHFGESIGAGGEVVWGTVPASACTITRERHESVAPNDDPAAGLAGIPVQISFSYFDGNGDPFVRKVQAEPDPVAAAPNGPSRWIANGRTIVNNKGNPVLQYEPYFSPADHRFAEPQTVGVSAVMTYDAPGRLVRTEFPDGTLSRTEFTPWLRRSFDANDTVLDPGNRWYAENSATNAEPHARRAAKQASLHAGTPTEIHFDSLAREVIGIAFNRVPDEAAAPPLETTVVDWGWKDERSLTFTKFDAEGKPLWVCDARGNLVMQHVYPPRAGRTPLNDPANADYRPAYEMPAGAVTAYDVAGNALFQHSMDAGDRRMLMDAAGQPLLTWDFNERGDTTTANVFREHRRIEFRYDALHRPLEQRLRVRDESNGATSESLVALVRYGEDKPNAAADNLRGQVWQQYDGSGLVQTDAFDLAGKPLVSRRRLASEIEAPSIDWTVRALSDINAGTAPGFESEVFTQRAGYDALGRLARQYTWHLESPPASGRSERVSVCLPIYNRRGSLAEETLLVRARKTSTGHDVVAGVTRSQKAIARIDYDARGQKLRVDRGNGTVTQYDYDLRMFRLRVMRTTRAGYNPAFPQRRSQLADERVLQHLHYAYDAAGNITEIHDDAWTPAFFRNQQVEATSRFVYDALYRLIESTGRENGAANGAPAQLEGPAVGIAGLPIDTAGALRNYKQRYRYDFVGNIAEMRHLAPAGGPAEPPGWTRNYRYAIDSNRLLETWQGRTQDPALGNGNIVYRYDTHGNMLNTGAAIQPFDLRWDRNDMLHTVDLGGGGRAWYQYGADKHRCRKVIVHNPARNGTNREERIDLGGYELYRRYIGDPDDPVEEIESLHLFEGDERILLVDDVLKARNPRPDSQSVKAQTLWRYQYSNHLGTAGLELDGDAEIVSYEEFHPYGTTSYQAIRSATEAPRKRYRYIGMERDEESGLGHHGARYCAAWLGRWISADSAGIGDGPNLYAYAQNSPTGGADSSGYQTGPVGLTNSPFIASGRYGWLHSMPGYTREHIIPGSWLKYALESYYGKPAVAGIKGRLYRNAWTSLLDNFYAGPKTSADLSFAAELRMLRDTGKPIEVTDFYLRAMRNLQEAGKLPSQELALAHETAVRELVSYVKGEKFAAMAKKGQAVPRELAEQLKPSGGPAAAASEPTKTPKAEVFRYEPKGKASTGAAPAPAPAAEPVAASEPAAKPAAAVEKPVPVEVEAPAPKAANPEAPPTKSGGNNARRQNESHGMRGMLFGLLLTAIFAFLPPEAREQFETQNLEFWAGLIDAYADLANLKPAPEVDVADEFVQKQLGKTGVPGPGMIEFMGRHGYDYGGMNGSHPIWNKQAPRPEPVRNVKFSLH